MNEALVFSCGMALFVVIAIFLFAVEALIQRRQWLWKAMVAVNMGIAIYFVVRFARWATG